MVTDLFGEIAQADEVEIEKILKAVLRRYAVLFPDWEVSTISLPKNPERNEQINRMIEMLKKLKSNCGDGEITG